MKTLLLLVALGSAVVWIRSENAKEQARARAQSEKFLAEMRAAEEAATPDRESRKWTQLSDGRWIEHDRRVSAMQSIGGGGGYYGAPATKAPKTSSDHIRESWGWPERKGALDQPARR